MAGGEVQRINEARRILLSEGLACEAEDVVGYDRLPDSLAAVRPDLVLVYCNGAKGEGLEAIRATQNLVSAAVLAVGVPDVAPDARSDARRAREYLDVNNLRHDLTAALASIETALAGASRRGQILTVFSPVGGVGVSTIALNLAVALAKLNPKPDPDKFAALRRQAAPAAKGHGQAADPAGLRQMVGAAGCRVRGLD